MSFEFVRLQTVRLSSRRSLNPLRTFFCKFFFVSFVVKLFLVAALLRYEICSFNLFLSVMKLLLHEGWFSGSFRDAFAGSKGDHRPVDAHESGKI